MGLSIDFIFIAILAVGAIGLIYNGKTLVDDAKTLEEIAASAESRKIAEQNARRGKRQTIQGYFAVALFLALLVLKLLGMLK